MEQTEDEPVAEVQDNQSTTLALDLIADLPNELWVIILSFVYCDNDGGDFTDILRALDHLKAEFSSCSKNIRLVYKTFNAINNSRCQTLLKERLRELYRSVLTRNFLEMKDKDFIPKIVSGVQYI